MRIEDFEGVTEAVQPDEIVAALSKRQKGVNEFWLSHAGEEYPAMSLLVRGDLATLIYLPHEGHPGFVPSGNPLHLANDATHEFLISRGGETAHVRSEAVLPFERAREAAIEFSRNSALPKSIQWFEL